MNTIAVAFDFSNGSINALSHAKKMAKMMDHKVVIVHSYSPPILDPNVPVGLIEETFRDSVKILEEKLDKEVNLAKKEGLDAEYKLAFSDLSSILNDINKSEAVSFVVVGKTGEQGFFETLIGSTASHLVDNLEAPLLVIPENYDSTIFAKIGYASQLEYDEEDYIKKALDFSKFSPLNLELVHIQESEDLNIYPDEQFLDSILKKFEEEKLDIIQKESKSFKKGINEFIEAERISLLILTTHKRGLFQGILNPSKTKQVIKHTKIPILVYTFNE
ncbi:MAG: universal stress protein [Leadbetterella sp.]|nr:universal stress protein [Leadbetterella sp.]